MFESQLNIERECEHYDHLLLGLNEHDMRSLHKLKYRRKLVVNKKRFVFESNHSQNKSIMRLQDV